MIILEGVDKAGKTTLANKLSEKYGLEIRKFGIPKGDPTFEYSKTLRDISSPIILDRFLFGELPYSIVKRRTRYMDYLAYRILLLQLLTVPHLVIYLRPEREEIHRRLEKEPDSYVSHSEVDQLIEEYDNVFEYNFTNAISCNGLLNTTHVAKIEEAINGEAWERRRQDESLSWEFIGSSRPRFLFVGERFNVRAEHQVPFWSSSGEYLHRSLDNAGVNQRYCTYTNAVSSDSSVIPASLVKRLHPKKIICLGTVAYERIKQLGYRNIAVKVNHPAHAQRFQSNVNYAEVLKQACSL